MEDKRRQDRIDCDIIMNKVEAGHTNICRAMDLSLGGMRLKRMTEPYRAKDISLKLQFELPGEDEPIWVGATKVYEDEESVGVRFTNISHGHFVKLRGWLRNRNIAQELPEFSC
ncbi:MAG: PilZ domain-containing protein [Bradymonadaceae bacterium]